MGHERVLVLTELGAFRYGKESVNHDELYGPMLI